MPINDARAKQALYMTRKQAKSRGAGPVGGVLRGKAIVWLALAIAGVVGAVWAFWSML
jgi:hypothetical protein